MQEQDSATGKSSPDTQRKSAILHQDRSRSRGSRSRSRSGSGSRSRSRSRAARYQHNSRHDSSDTSRSRGGSSSPHREHDSHRGSNSSHRDRDRDRDRDLEKEKERDRDHGYERRLSDRNRGYRSDSYQPDSRQSNSRYEGNGRHRQQSSWRRSENDSMQGEPQLEIIMQGLPLNCQENDIRATIEHEDIGLEAVRLARDRHTGESRGFGFLKFFTLQQAQDFMKHFSPSIKVGQSWVRIAYSKNPSGSRDSHRRCPECGMSDGHLESCHQFLSSKQARPGPYSEAPYHHHHQQQQHMQQSYPVQGYPASYQQVQLPALNVGTSDIGSVPHSILVVTDLPSMVNEAALWKSMSALGPLVRILLAKDRQSRISWGFCFAEYTDVKSAAMAMDKANEDTFMIVDKPVEVHYAHHGSFIPAYAPTQWTISLGSEGKLAIYWDEQAFLSGYVDPSAAVAAVTPKAAPNTGLEKAPSKSAADELDAFYASMGDVLKSGAAVRADSLVFSVPAAKDSGTSSIVPAPTPFIQDLPTIPTTAKVDKVQLAGIAAAQAAEQLAKAEEKKRKAGQASIGIGGGGKKVSIQLQKWSSKQVELQSGEVPEAVQSPPSAAAAALQIPDPSQEQQDSSYSSFEPEELLDFSLIACLLCQRRLKTVQDLRKHQALSDLHKKNLLDPHLVEAALMKARGGSSSSSSTFGTPTKSSTVTLSVSPLKVDDEPKYRDRAAERRHIFGQPDYPLPPTPSSREYGGRAVNSGGGSGAGGSRYGGSYRGGGSGFGGALDQEMIIPEQPTKDGIKDDNIGNRLLKSMGWKEGQGLGKDGEGIKAPIEASGYSKGVGIGAGLVRKADGASQIRGPLGNYAETAKELARRRYDQSG